MDIFCSIKRGIIIKIQTIEKDVVQVECNEGEAGKNKIIIVENIVVVTKLGIVHKNIANHDPGQNQKIARKINY